MPRHWGSREAAAVCAAAGLNDPVAAMQQLAASLIDQVGFAEPPFDPRILASFRDVREVRQVPMYGAARLFPDGRGLIIEVNQEHSRGKQNFSIAHEVSHTLIPTYSNRRVDDQETGTFPGHSEEELLCDIGAAALLLDPRWLARFTYETGPSIALLQSVANMCDASLEATAWQLTAVAPWAGAFVFWEEGLRKADLNPPGQLSLGLTGVESSELKLRVASCYPTASFQYFVPWNKSILDTSLVAACSDAEPRTWEKHRDDRAVLREHARTVSSGQRGASPSDLLAPAG